MAKLGRKTKYNDEVVGIICRHLKDGYPRTVACAAAGICQETYYRWRQVHPEFEAAVDKAIGRSEAALVDRLKEAADEDWRAAKFLLERRFRHWNAVPYGTREGLDAMNAVKLEHARLELEFLKVKVDALKRLSEPEDTVTVLEVLSGMGAIEDKGPLEIDLECGSEDESGERRSYAIHGTKS